MLRTCLAVLMSVSIVVGCGPLGSTSSTGGNYPPVTEAELIGKKCANRTGQDDGAFQWAFEKDRFVLEGTDIPPDLLLVMLGEDAKSEKIEGTWEIDDDENIHFFVETDQPEGKPRESKLRIFFTGVIRIQTDDAQYVF
ncbi:hypothetical protein [Aeoliella sp.]|uniref:hypothetical protein n=1 Tax=Aeoliella sp. TaxID=2795800 RepID=UPI003CCB9A7C